MSRRHEPDIEEIEQAALREIRLRAQESYSNATLQLRQIIDGLHWRRRSRAQELVTALDEVVVGEEEPVVEVIQRFLLVAVLGAVFLIVPVGICVGTLAYFAGLSNEVGRWMIYAGTTVGALAFAIGFTFGRGNPARRVI